MDKNGVPPTKRFVFGNRVTWLDSIPEIIRPWRKCGDPGLPWV
ncbi:hypothetical protein Tco_0809006, partial [Tanacetum coccineum]